MGWGRMNKTEEYSVNLANEALDTIKYTLEEYKKGHSHNNRIETIVDATSTEVYSTIKLDVTVYHDWEAKK